MNVFFILSIVFITFCGAKIQKKTKIERIRHFFRNFAGYKREDNNEEYP